MIDSHLTWNYHTEMLAAKLSRNVGMLAKIRHYVTNDTLRTIYFGIFSSIMMCGSQVWGQIQNKCVNRIIKLQDRAIRVINFASYFASRNQLYKKSSILKLSDSIQLSNFLMVHDSFNHALPMAFKDTFKPIKEKHKYSTRGAINQHVTLPNVRTQIYGIKSVVYQSS